MLIGIAQYLLLFMAVAIINHGYNIFYVKYLTDANANVAN